MTVEDKERYERLARGVASGLTKATAARVAGYPKGAPDRAKDRKFNDRVDELKTLMLWTGSFEPAPLIMELLAASREARTTKTGAGMSAAAAMLAEIGRLTARRPPRRTGRLTPGDDMSDDEWAATYGPPS